MKICAYCGSEFTPNNGKQKCCSQNCNVMLWRKNNSDKDKKSQEKQNEKRKIERANGIKRYNSEVRKEWYKNKSNDANWKDKINTQYNDRRAKIQEFIRSYKLSKGCTDCGYNKHHAALEFDHVTGEKKFNVCNARSIMQAKGEIEKCEVVCSNCHKIRTFERLQ